MSVTSQTEASGIGLGADQASRMRYRPLGATGMAAGEVAFGSHLTRGNVDDPAGRQRQIRLGIEHGINLFDIYEHSYQQFAPMSAALAPVRDQVILSLVTVWRAAAEVPDEVEYALRVFQRDCIDLYRAVLGGDWGDSEQRLEALSRAKEQGKVRAVGAVVHYPEHLLEGLRRYPGLIEYVMVPVSFCAPLAIREDRPLAGALRCSGVGVIAMKPMAAADGDGGHIFKLQPASAEAAALRRQGLQLARLALKYVLQSDVVSCVLPTMNSVDEVRQNVSASGSGPLTAAEARFIELHREEAERVFPALLGSNDYWITPWKG
jgi:uncharacterized protein